MKKSPQTSLRRFSIATVFLGVALSGTAVSSDDDGDHVKMEASIETKSELLVEYNTDGCRAMLQLDYHQRGDFVRVASTLTNDQCAASSGNYTLRVKYRDDTGEVSNKDFPESWQRSDALPVSLQKDYFVAENVDVVRVKTRKLSCFCGTDDPEQEPDE